jgi:hypothetical protein
MVFKPTVYSNFIAGEAQVLPTKRCRLSWLTNSALVFESQCGWRFRPSGSHSQPRSTAVHITWHGAQINFGDLPPYLTYVPIRTLILSSQPTGGRFYVWVGPGIACLLEPFFRQRLSLRGASIFLDRLFSALGFSRWVSFLRSDRISGVWTTTKPFCSVLRFNFHFLRNFFPRIGICRSFKINLI